MEIVQTPGPRREGRAHLSGAAPQERGVSLTEHLSAVNRALQRRGEVHHFVSTSASNLLVQFVRHLAGSEFGDTMATAAAAVRKPDVKEFNFTWVGTDSAGKTVRGEMRATGEAQVNATLRRQGIKVVEVKRQRMRRGGAITDKDITLFTRQLATMMKSGVPLLQAFDIVGKGHSNAAVAKLLLDIKTEVETGSSLKQAFEKHPLYFDALFCNLIGAGEQAGILDSLLDRLATYKEKILAIKSKIKSALFYPVAIIVVAFVITAVIMIFVIPAFKQVFASFGADLPGLTLVVMAISDFFVEYWYAIFGGIGGAVWFFMYTWKRSVKMQIVMDRVMLRVPVFGDLVRKSAIARWTRTLSTMFAAGVPLVEALDRWPAPRATTSTTSPPRRSRPRSPPARA